MAKTQGLESYSANSSLHGRSTSDVGRVPDALRGASATASGSKGVPAPAPTQTKVLSPADLYAQAISARNESLFKQQSLPTPMAKPRIVVPQYMTAEQEKAALRRYEEAKMAVDRVQGYAPEFGDSGNADGSGSGGIPMVDPPNALHPVGNNDDLPPPFEMSANVNASVIPPSHIGEKVRLRQEYERQDAARMRLQRQDSLPPSFSESQSRSTSGSHGPLQPQTPHSGSTTYSRSPSSANTASPLTKRPTPVPPSAPSSSRILTAVEEKALLKARYAAEEQPKAADASPPYVNGNGHAHHINSVSPSPPRPGTSQSQAHSQSQSPAPPSLSHSNNSYSSTPEPPSSPPPLMPRPPVEYIQETQEEDARVSQFAMNGVLPPDEVISRSTSLNIKPKLAKSPSYLPTPVSVSPPLEVRPFSPFAANFEQATGLILPGPPPPLPPKPAED